MSSLKVPLKSSSSSGLIGSILVPGDKSISHRALILGSLAFGRTNIYGLLESADVLDTARAMKALGAEILNSKNGEYIINGVGIGGFSEPLDVINCGNSGTSARLIIGAVSTSPINVTFTGDDSLRNRPMSRVLNPISLFGADYIAREDGYLPVSIKGVAEPIPIIYTLPVASAQVKSAILLGALNTPGKTKIIEENATRDHTERMLNLFGADISSVVTPNGNEITIAGFPELVGTNLKIPSDPSSAAFPVCAALIVKGSDVTVPNVCQNPTRNELFSVLIRMGAEISFENEREESGEKVADVRALYSPDIVGVDILGDRAALMIDEYPILAMVAAVAKGKTRMKGIGELRHKESDRIKAITQGLRAVGVKVQEEVDSLTIVGSDSILGGSVVEVCNDHRIAMSFSCLGMVAKSPITIDDSAIIATSFPDFVKVMVDAGAVFETF